MNFFFTVLLNANVSSIFGSTFHHFVRWHRFHFNIFLCLLLTFSLSFGFGRLFCIFTGFLNTLKLLFWWLYIIWFYVWICILIANNLLFLQIFRFGLRNSLCIRLFWGVSLAFCLWFFLFFRFWSIFQIFILSILISEFFAWCWFWFGIFRIIILRDW